MIELGVTAAVNATNAAAPAGTPPAAWIIGTIGGAFVAGVGSALATVWVQRRRQSGSVSTSEAGELWAAMKDLLEKTTTRADALQGEVDSLREDLAVVTDSNQGLRFQLEAAREVGERLREERAHLQREVDRLTIANATLDRQVAHLTTLLEKHNIDPPEVP